MKNHKTSTALSDFKLFPGERLYINKGATKTQVTLTGFVPDQGLFVTLGQRLGEGLLPNSLKVGDSISVRMVSANHVLSFDTQVIQLCQSPFPYLVLSWPKTVGAKKLRKHARVPVELRVALDVEDDTADLATLHGLCSNLSLSGAAVQLSEPVGTVGDAFYLTVRLSVGEQDQVLLLPAKLRNIQQLESTPIPVYRHGLAFHDVDEDAELVLTAYIYQQFLVETGYIDVV